MCSYFPPVNSFDNDSGFNLSTSRYFTPPIENHSALMSTAGIDWLVSWPDMEVDPRRSSSPRKYHKHSMAQQMSYVASAVSQHGQITPSLSNLTSSSRKPRAIIEQNPQPTGGKGSTKAKVKQKKLIKLEAHSIKRKQKTNQKTTHLAIQLATSQQYDKREISLQKNKKSTAKCRINKKEKIDQTQQDSREKAVENTILRDTITHMNEEVQQLRLILLSHSSSDHCKGLESIPEAAEVTRSHGFANQVFNNNLLETESQKIMRQLNSDRNMHGDYVQPFEAPALPEFDFHADFEVRTPMLED